MDARFVYQVTHHWRKGKELLTVNLRYITPTAVDRPRPRQPGNGTQFVTILLDDYGENLKLVLEQLKLNC
jgi:hypothetical protein